jgi:hypothetical protein
MKLKILRSGTPEPVVRRFPYLRAELQQMVNKDESFKQLCKDYKDLVNTLKQTSANTSDTRTDLLGLKTSLEVEILEQVSRKGASKQN